MKLTMKDIAYLFSIGCPKEDIPQICEAALSKNTTYKLNGKTITAKKAIEVLGRDVYLSGLNRSAFHRTTVRVGKQGEEVFFNSANLFR